MFMENNISEDFKIVNSKIENGEWLLQIEENGIIKEYELNEADSKFGKELINEKYNEYLEK